MRTRFLLAWALGLCAAIGCATGVSFLDLVPPAPTAEIGQVVASWNPQLQSLPNATLGGKPLPALAGQVRLFAAGGNTPALGDGDLVVELCREDQVGEDMAVIPLQEWRIDRSRLNHFRQRDDGGWGYALVLPWAGYSAAIQHVQIRTCFEPAGGNPVQAESASLSFGADRQEQLARQQLPTNDLRAPNTVPQALTRGN
jgi:hypothetical protein